MDANGSVTATNTFGAVGLVSRASGGSDTFYAFDERGNVAQRLNQYGSVTSADLYDAYGKVTAGAQPDPWGFGGQAGYYTDNETGLLLLTNRFYDPQQGRFLTRDPMGYGGGVNLYGYVGNNPGNGLDPSGLKNADGSPDNGDAFRDGLNVGFKAVASAFSFGAYDGGDAKCDSSFGTSVALAGVGRDALITAVTLGAGEGAVAAERGGQAAEEATEAEQAAANCFGKCFTASTPVVMADGTTKPISEVQPGDRVRSRDPQTGREEARTVTASIQRQARAVVTVSVSDAKTGKSEALTCTPEHPFFAVGRGWVEAGSLGIGTSLVSRAGPGLTVQALAWHRAQTLDAGSTDGKTSNPNPYTVYNLTVEGDHTFFVGRAGGGTWVHNITCYRGVARDNVNYPDALEGNAYPRGGSASAEEHNAFDTDSPFTSWTTNPRIAVEKALDSELGGRGVVLTKDFAESELTRSLDIYDEAEVLVRGPVTGASLTWVP